MISLVDTICFANVSEGNSSDNVAHKVVSIVVAELILIDVLIGCHDCSLCNSRIKGEFTLTRTTYCVLGTLNQLFVACDIAKLVL